MNKVYISDKSIKEVAVKTVEKIEASKWRPDLIIAVTRGGLIPAGYISYFLDVSNVDTVKLQTYEGETQTLKQINEQEYQLQADLQKIIKKWKPTNILIVDDLIDTCFTLSTVDTILLAVQNYFKMIGEKIDFDWKFAVLYSNSNKELLNKDVYYGEEKPEGWLVFPWDERN